MAAPSRGARSGGLRGTVTIRVIILSSLVLTYPAVHVSRFTPYAYLLTCVVTHDVHVLPKRCDCGSDKESKKGNCHFTVLESSLKFPMHRFSAPSEPKWTLALLCLPKHPEFDKQMENVKHINYLSIETSVLGKGQHIPLASAKISWRPIKVRTASAFQKAIETVMKIRDRQHTEFEDGHRRARVDSECMRPDNSSSATASVLASSVLKPPSSNIRSSSSVSVLASS